VKKEAYNGTFLNHSCQLLGFLQRAADMRATLCSGWSIQCRCKLRHADQPGFTKVNETYNEN